MLNRRERIVKQKIVKNKRDFSKFNKEHQAAVNAYQCNVCKQSFMNTARRMLREHVTSKHSGKNGNI